MDQWQRAEASGRVAGLNMAGQSVEMSEVAYLKSEMFDLTLQSWGDARFVHHRLVRGSPTLDAPHFAEIGISEDGRVAQVVCVGEPEDEAIFARLVKGRVAVNGNAEQLKDPNVPLSRVLDLPAGDDRG
jgi:3-phenylpropionate/trans-cinnamate dioxygenase ferredoxin reductase subunit